MEEENEMTLDRLEEMYAELDSGPKPWLEVRRESIADALVACHYAGLLDITKDKARQAAIYIESCIPPGTSDDLEDLSLQEHIEAAVRRHVGALNALESHLGCSICGGPLVDDDVPLSYCPDCQKHVGPATRDEGQ